MNQANEIILELHYLPPIQYFTKFILYPNVGLEQWENYSKGSYRNRAHIAGVNGLLRLSIPLLKGKNEQQNIRAVEIAYHESWQAQHWTSIRSAYGNAPYFEHYCDFLFPFYKKKYQFLFDWNLNLLKCILDLLEINANFKLTSNFQKSYPDHVYDARNSIFPKKHRQKQDPFFKVMEYAQVFVEKNGFIPNLSILDLLFCCGPQSILILESSIIHQPSQ